MTSFTPGNLVHFTAAHNENFVGSFYEHMVVVYTGELVTDSILDVKDDEVLMFLRTEDFVDALGNYLTKIFVLWNSKVVYRVMKQGGDMSEYMRLV